MAHAEGVAPSEKELLIELPAFKLANPGMGATFKMKHAWFVIESLIKKVAGLYAPAPHIDKQTMSDDGTKRPPQVPALNVSAPPAVSFAVVEELIASTERQRRLDDERHQSFMHQMIQNQQHSQHQFQQQLLQNQLQMQQQLLQSQQAMFQQQQLQLSQFQEQQLKFQEKQQQQMMDLTSTLTTTIKSVESALTRRAETDSVISVETLPSLQSVIESIKQDDAVGFTPSSGDPTIRTAAIASIQQPTIDQVRAAPNCEDAGRKGVADGGFVKVSKQASIIHVDKNSKFQVLLAAPPASSTAVGSQVLAVTVPRAHKFNPETYSEFSVRETPGGPEIRVPVLPSKDIRCPDEFQLFDPVSNKQISGKVTLVNVDHPEQPPVVLRIPGQKIDLSANFREGKYRMTIEAEGHNSITVERVVAFGPRKDRSRDLILNLMMEKFDLSLKATFSDEEQLRAVLQWRNQPRDLDLHLFSFKCSTWKQVTHCFYGNRSRKLGLEHKECLFLDRDDTQGNGCETLTLGQVGPGAPSMNREHAYVWMVKQYSSEAPRSGGMKHQYMSVAFSGVRNHVFTNDSDAPVNGPEDSRWWLVAMTKFDAREGWKFYGLNRLLPVAETGSGDEPNLAAILPHIQRA